MKAIISGVAGFIGSHMAIKLLASGAEVIGTDNLSRPGARQNLAWLKSAGADLTFRYADLRNRDQVDFLFRSHPDSDLIVHTGGQVAVTTSMTNPRLDFEVNALGTLNMLEATRNY